MDEYNLKCEVKSLVTSNDFRENEDLLNDVFNGHYLIYLECMNASKVKTIQAALDIYNEVKEISNTVELPIENVLYTAPLYRDLLKLIDLSYNPYRANL